ncbi:hypothetical protein SFC57_18475 [Niallia circulans]|uniref:hypothetical protein n=1 Tax=Niallia circulans TaxID=1397 RepID=UPI00155FA280|nr:hypothetical protein [Niallia circulans]NRG34669.1 hypothetical protein [Niallia circulans]
MLKKNNKNNFESGNTQVVIDIEESPYKVDTEEKVILDFMNKENIDRTTEKANLGIVGTTNNESSKGNYSVIW